MSVRMNSVDTLSTSMSRRAFLALAAGSALALFGVVPAGEALANVGAAGPNSYTYTVSVAKGYLALRTAPAYDSANEIGALYSGDTVQVQCPDSSDYWWVYAPRLGQSGYVNRRYLAGGDYTFTVSVAKGYLALRTGKAYDSSNELGALYTGDTVKVYDTSDSTYWYVYAPRLNMSGYVNRNYLIGGEQVCPTYLVSVAKGYLALRTDPSYDASNEIGPLDSGDTVQVRSTGYGDYWYVYAPRYQCSGYVNANYLYGLGSYSGSGAYTVSVAKGYLALRAEMSYDSSNEIGALYSGEVVYLQNRTGTKYVYVYAPSLGCYGYANGDYLF